MWKKLCLIILISTSYGAASMARCKLNEFRCEDGTCLKSEKLCDVEENCVPHGEDEKGSDRWDCSRLTLGTSAQCEDNRKFYKCRFGGECVPRGLVCDGQIDCFGGSDEASDLCGSGGLRPVPGHHDQQIPVQRPKPIINRPSKQPTHPPSTRPTPTSPQRPVTSSPTRPPNHGVVPRPTKPIMGQTPAHGRPNTPSKGEQGHGCKLSDLMTEEGEETKCRKGRVTVNCRDLDTPIVANGTVVAHICKRHYSPPRNGPSLTKRFCNVNHWSRKNSKFFCDVQCGKGGSNLISFIVNGTQSKLGKWPWVVSFYQQNPPGSGRYEHFCGGTLITAKQVLTAAHCVAEKDTEKKRTDDIILGFGKYYRAFGKNDEFVRFRKISRIDIHPDYQSQIISSDIAIVWLNESLELSERIVPACLPLNRQAEVEAGDFGSLAGWGRFDENEYPERLQEADLPVVSSRTCQKAHPSLEQLVRGNSFCAGYVNGTSACEGDSGGGLVFEFNGAWSVHGIVSAGVSKKSGGCDPRYYTVFTRISKFREWIDAVLDSSRLKFRR